MIEKESHDDTESRPRVRGDLFWRGTVYPDGEFSFCRQKRISGDSEPQPRVSAEQRGWVTNLVRMHGVLSAIQCFKDYDCSNKVPVGEKSLDERLDLSSVSNSEKKPRGFNGITAKGRRRVRNACFLLEKNYGKARLTFLTLTLPPLDDGVFCEVSSRWGSIVELLCKSVRRRLKDAGLPSYIVGVTEIQSSRLGTHGGIPLHLHVVFVGRHDRGPWKIRPLQIRKAWKNAVSNCVSSDLSTVDFSSVENLQRVHKSCSGYLAKYLTKGSDTIALIVERFPGIRVPTQWYTCTRNMVEWIERSKVIPGPDAMNMLVFAVINGVSEICNYRSLKRLTSNAGHDFVIAGKAWLSSHAMRLVGELTRNHTLELSAFLK